VLTALPCGALRCRDQINRKRDKMDTLQTAARSRCVPRRRPRETQQRGGPAGS
jgi:hypothetical protein